MYSLKILELNNQCSGCYACKNICPRNAVDLVPDRHGFVTPVVDNNKCIMCRGCENVCPVINKPKSTIDYTRTKIYAAWSKNEKTRFASTSGGVFTEIAEYVLSHNGVVCGAVYDRNEGFAVKHVLVSTIEELSEIRRSKYAQSDLGLIFRDIQRELKDNKLVLFCGTPCECSGLKRFLKKEYNNLIVCDFICRGANSPKAFKKYLESISRKYNSRIKEFNFRDKTSGWEHSSTRIVFENGRVYLRDRYTDYYMRGYLDESLYMRPSCQDCNFKNHSEFSDITMGDFWGYNGKHANKKAGVSVVLIHSTIGERVFADIKPKLYCEERIYEDAFGENPSLEKSVHRNSRADQFLEEIDLSDFCDVMTEYTDFTIKYRIFHKLKQIFWTFGVDTTRIKKILGK